MSLPGITFRNLYLKQGQYIVDEQAVELLQNLFEKVRSAPKMNFSNGRFVRNLFEKIITNQANRVILIPNLTNEDLITIKSDDLVDIKMP